jgi:hypothetical protein
MSVCVGELTALLRLARSVDFKAVASRLDARLYQDTGFPAAALFADLRACFNTWRLAADKVSHKAADKAASVSEQLAVGNGSQQPLFFRVSPAAVLL